MDKLFELGISDIDMKNIIEQIPGIINMNNNEISEKIDLLKYVGCSDRQIKNIIIGNPDYLDRINEDILKLIGYLKRIGFDDLSLLFESNPSFLNYDVFEIRNYIDDQIGKEKEIDDIIDEIESNPYIIDEE